MEQIGKYRVLDKIGQGATGSVYRGYDAVLGRHVAIKVISADVGADDTGRERFRREAQAAGRLAHPHIVTVYDFGEERDQLYMAMELLEGGDLKQAIAERRLRTLDQKLDVMEQICDGLAHQHSIVHRDLKPANIHLLADGQVKIVDFGLARFSGSNMTRAGLVMGTPHYMSPEQVRGEQVDARSDVFSLGCVLYELVSGRKPFEAESLHSVLYMVLQAQPPPLREAVPGLPRVVQQLIDRALARDRSQRFPDAGEFLGALQQVREAIAAGRGDEPIPELEVPPAAEGEASAPRSRQMAVLPALEPVARPSAAASPGVPGGASSSGSRPRAGSRSSSVPPKAARTWVLRLLAGGGLLVVIAGGTLLLTLGGRETPGRRPAAPQMDQLARAVVETQVELARRRLEAGDHEDAARQAERALKLAPDDAGAKEVLAEARRIRERIDAAVAAARSAAGGKDRGRAVEAYWTLLEVAPEHPTAGELAGLLDPDFRPRAQEAQRLAAQARQAAEEARASRVESFQEGAALVQDGETALRGRKFAAAARGFMIARLRFQRAESTGR